MMPVGFQSRTHCAERVEGWISEYTRASRTRRAISCVNWDPKSRSRILAALMWWWRPVGVEHLQFRQCWCVQRASELPLGAVQSDEVHLLGIQVEDRGAGRPVHPAAGLAGIHDERVALLLQALLVREAVDDDA